MPSLEEYFRSLGLRNKTTDQKEELAVSESISRETDSILVENQESLVTLNYIPEERKEYLYVVADEINQVCKIGISESPKKRLQTLQTGYPTPLKMIFSVDLKNARTVELMIHKALDDFRLRGEWFYLDAYYLIDWENLCVEEPRMK